MNKFLLEEIEQALPNVVGFSEEDRTKVADFLEALSDELDNEEIMDFSQLVRRS